MAQTWSPSDHKKIEKKANKERFNINACGWHAHGDHLMIKKNQERANKGIQREEKTGKFANENHIRGSKQGHMFGLCDGVRWIHRYR